MSAGSRVRLQSGSFVGRRHPVAAGRYRVRGVVPESECLAVHHLGDTTTGYVLTFREPG